MYLVSTTLSMCKPKIIVLSSFYISVNLYGQLGDTRFLFTRSESTRKPPCFTKEDFSTFPLVSPGRVKRDGDTDSTLISTDTVDGT